MRFLPDRGFLKIWTIEADEAPQICDIHEPVDGVNIFRLNT